MLVDIEVDADEHYTREIDPEDSWDIGERGLTINGVRVRETNGRFGEEFAGSVGDPCWVVVEHYFDGCTFGSSEYAEPKGPAFRTEGEAESHRESLPKPNHGYFGGHLSYRVFMAVVGARQW